MERIPSDAGFPASQPPPLERRLRQLAQAYVQEPELISACLQTAPQRLPAHAAQILAAAQLALKECPGYADLYYHAGHAAIAAGELETAAALLDGALRANPNYTDALILAARLALRRHQPAQARTLLQTALDKGADYADVHMLLGGVWQAEENWTQARASYERALALNANLTAARKALAGLPT